MMFGSAVLLVAACAFNAVHGYGGNECQTDDCLKAVIGTRSQPCLYRCKSFMKVTVTPTPTTAYKTVTEAATEHTTTGVTQTDTKYLTVTSTEFDVVTVTSGLTHTEFTSKTATVTVTTTVTSQGYEEPARNEIYKRDAHAKADALARLRGSSRKNAKRNDDGPRTRYPTCMATKIVNACSNTAAYSSACSCIGVSATTITKPQATTTKTTTVTDRTGSVHQSTVTKTTFITDATEYQTVKSSTTVRVTATTVTSETIVGTITKTVTSTVAGSSSSTMSSSIASSSAPPSPSPGLSFFVVSDGEIAYNDLDAQSFPYVGFRSETEAAEKNIRWDIDSQTGLVTLVSMDSQAEELYDRTLVSNSLFHYPDGVSSSYVFLTWPEYAVELDAKPVSCSVVGSSGSGRLSCKFNGQTADMWLCAGSLKLTAPGYDLPNGDPACGDAASRVTVHVTQGEPQVISPSR